MEDTNINDIVSKFKDILGDSSNGGSSHKNVDSSVSDSSTPSLDSEILQNIIQRLGNSSAKSSNSSNDNYNDKSSSNENLFDIETILKLKNIISSINNKNDPRSNFLYSLKPYLRESRQKKIDQYINFFKLAQITSLFKNEKGE